MKKLISILAIVLMPAIVLAQVGSGIIIDNSGGGAGGGIVGAPPTTIGAIPRWLDIIAGSLGDSKWILDSNSNMSVIQPPIAGGTPTLLSLTGGVLTNVTAGTEQIDINLNFGRVVTHLVGDYSAQRTFYLNPPTYSYSALTNIPLMATAHIEGMPRAGTFAAVDTNTGLLVGKLANDFTTASKGQQVTIGMPGIANSTGNASERSGLAFTSFGDIHLGDQIATLDGIWGVKSPALSFEASALRTVSEAAHYLMDGAYHDNGGGNVTFSRGPWGLLSRELTHKMRYNDAQTTIKPVIRAQNESAATAVQPQYSPAILVGGNVWNNVGLAQHSIDVASYLATPADAVNRGNYKLASSIDGGAFNTFMSIATDSSGEITSDHVLFDFANLATFEVSESGKYMQFSLVDNGATGPTFYLSLNTATPAANDLIGSWVFLSNNLAPAQFAYSSVSSTIQSAVAGAERSSLKMSVSSLSPMYSIWDGNGRTFDFIREDDGLSGAMIRLRQVSASPAAGDSTGVLVFTGDQDYARIRGMIDDPAAPTGKGSIELSVMQDTNLTQKAFIDYHGLGIHTKSPNASFYVQSRPYNDFVVRIHPQDVSGLVAGVSQTDVVYERATKTWDAGNFPTQVWMEHNAQNAAAAGASQIDDAILARYSNPTAGANMTLLRRYALVSQNLRIDGSQTVKVVDVNASPWNATQSDYFFGVSKTATGAVTLNLPDASDARSIAYIVKDTGNNAAVNNISVTPAGADTIDGVAAAKVMNVNLSAYMFVSDGVTNWSVLKMF